MREYNAPSPFVLRDNRSGGGGVNYDTTTINVTTSAGPFAVTAPNAAVHWTQRH
ncbi:MAG: hypothetical protein R3E79_04245 [Caldilineaceae bacterium]